MSREYGTARYHPVVRTRQEETPAPTPWEDDGSEACPFEGRVVGGLWTIDFRLLGRWVRVRSADRSFVEGLQACFQAPPAPSEADGSYDLRVLVARDPERDALRVESRPAGALEHAWPWPIQGPRDLCSALNQWTVGFPSGRYVFHAAALRWGERAILLPGSSRSGKTTLAAQLVRDGLPIFSDEVAAVEMGTRSVAAYPRCLSVRTDVLGHLGLEADGNGSASDDEARMVRPEELGGARAEGESEVAMIVAPRYEPGADTRLEELGGGPAVMALMASSCSQPQFKTRGLDWVVSLVEAVPRRSLPYSDVVRASEVLRRELARCLGEGP